MPELEQALPKYLQIAGHIRDRILRGDLQPGDEVPSERQIAAEWNVSLQVPVLDAVIAKKPDAIMIAPTDKVQLIAPLKKAHDAGIPIVCVDTFIGTGVFQTGSGDADFPISYVASDNVLGGRMAARALAKAIGEKGKVYVSNVKPGISTTDQR